MGLRLNWSFNKFKTGYERENNVEILQITCTDLDTNLYARGFCVIRDNWFQWKRYLEVARRLKQSVKRYRELNEEITRKKRRKPKDQI